tara:strand:+ start:3403 stop:5358 length:1956 start_codon:yes stop_codon:yes gene_type:complete
MGINILGGFLKGYNDDQMLAKKIEADALSLGAESTLKQKIAARKRTTDMADFKEKEKFKAGLKPSDTFTTEFEDGTSVVFPVSTKFGSNTSTEINRIDETLRLLDSKDKTDQFINDAINKGNYGSNFIDYIKGFRDNKTVSWGPEGKNPPIGINFNVDPNHYHGDYFREIKIKTSGIDTEQVKDNIPKSFIVGPPTNGLYDISTGGMVEGDEYLVRNDQVITPTSPYRTTTKSGPDNVHVYSGEGLPKEKFLQISVADMFNRNMKDDKSTPFILRDWDNFYTTQAVQDTYNDKGQLVREGQGLKVPMYVLEKNDAGEDVTVLKDIRISTGFNLGVWDKNIYNATNNARFRNGKYSFIDQSEFNTSPNSNYSGFAAIAEAGGFAESQIFLALDLFEDAADLGIDPISNAGTFFKFINDAVVSPDSQMRQWIRGFDAVVTGTIDEDYLELSDDRKNEIREANAGLKDYLSMGEEKRNKVLDDTARINTLLNQIFTLLAYNVALTTQGGTSLSARVSNEDYDNSKQAVVGSGFDTLENRMLGLMQYYESTIPKAFSFDLLRSAEGFGFQGKKTMIQNDLVPIIMDRPITENQLPLGGDYSNPYNVINYLSIRPNSNKKIKIWADAVKFAYRNNMDNIFNPDYDPNATSSSIDPA